MAPLYEVTDYVQRTLQKFEHINYPGIKFRYTYDESIDERVANMFMSYAKDKQIAKLKQTINQLLADANLPYDESAPYTPLKEGEDPKQRIQTWDKVFPNCWQTVFLLRLQSCPDLAIFADNFLIKFEEDRNKQERLLETENYQFKIDEISRNGFAAQVYRDDAYQLALTGDCKPISLAKTLESGREAEPGSTIFIFGQAHVAFYTQHSKALSNWAVTNPEISGFKELELDQITNYFFDHYSLIRPGLSELLRFLENDGSYSQIVNEINDYLDELDNKFGFFDADDTEQIAAFQKEKETIKEEILREWGEYIVRYSPPTMSIQLSLQSEGNIRNTIHKESARCASRFFSTSTASPSTASPTAAAEDEHPGFVA